MSNYSDPSISGSTNFGTHAFTCLLVAQKIRVLKLNWL